MALTSSKALKLLNKTLLDVDACRCSKNTKAVVYSHCYDLEKGDGLCNREATTSKTASTSSGKTYSAGMKNEKTSAKDPCISSYHPLLLCVGLSVFAASSLILIPIADQYAAKRPDAA